MNLRSEMLLDAKLIMSDGLRKMRPDVAIDAKGYVADWRWNLLPEIAPELIEGDLRRGKGSELDSKFRAAHSSAALVVNVFGPFRDGRRKFTLPGLGRLTLKQFEQTFPTGVPNGTPPHLDATALSDQGLVAMESKCLEILTPKVADFSPAYQLLADCRDTPWYAEMERLRAAPTHYQYLDVAQLIKHAFGLIHSADGTAQLMYLFWEPTDAAQHSSYREHREEIAEFAARVAGVGPTFQALSYPELWTHWAASQSEELRDHAARLFTRYGGPLGSYEGYTRIDGRRSDAAFFGEDWPTPIHEKIPN